MLLHKQFTMENDDLNRAIEELETHIRYLQNDYNIMLNQGNTLDTMRTMRMQIKQAEESLRLKKRIRYLFLN